MASPSPPGPKDELRDKLVEFKQKENNKQDKYEIIFERIRPIHIMIQSNIPDKAPFLLKSTSFASERPETATRAPKYSEYPFFTNEYEYPLTKMAKLKQHEIIYFFFNEAMFVELLRKYLKKSESLMIDTKDKFEENSKTNLMIMIQLMFRTTIPQTYNVTQTFRELIEFKPSNIYKKSVFSGKKEFTIIQDSSVKYTVLKAALLNDIFNNPIYDELFKLYYELTVFNDKQKTKIDEKMKIDKADFDTVGVPKIKKINILLTADIDKTTKAGKTAVTKTTIEQLINTELININKALNQAQQRVNERIENEKEKNKLEHIQLIISLLEAIKEKDIDKLLTSNINTIGGFKKTYPSTNIVDFADSFLIVDYLFVDGIISQEVLSYFASKPYLREIYRLFNEVKQIYVKIYRKNQQTKDITSVDITNVSQTGNDLYSKFSRKFKSICFPERQTTNPKLQEILQNFTKTASPTSPTTSLPTSPTPPTKIDLKTLFDVLNRCYNTINPKCRILKDERLKPSFKDFFNTGVTEVLDKKEDITTYEIYVHLDVAQGVITPQNMNTIQCIYSDNSLLHRFEQLVQKRKYNYWKLVPGPFVVLPLVPDNDTPGKKETFANIRDYFGTFTRKRDLTTSKKGGKRRRRTKKIKHYFFP